MTNVVQDGEIAPPTRKRYGKCRWDHRNHPSPLSPLVQSRFRPRENSCLLTPGHPEVPMGRALGRLDSWILGDDKMMVITGWGPRKR